MKTQSILECFVAVQWIYSNLTGRLTTWMTPIFRLVLFSPPATTVYCNTSDGCRAGFVFFFFLKETEHLHLEMYSIQRGGGDTKREIYAGFDPGRWGRASQTALGTLRCISVMMFSRSLSLVLSPFVCCHPLSLSLHYALQDFLL